MNTWRLYGVLSALLWHFGSSASVSSRNVVQPNLDCAFEDGLCGWRETSESYWLKWNLGQEGAQHTGPQRDHTTGYGFFLAMNTMQAHTAGSVHLTSPQIVTNQETCLSLWYYMKGYNIGSLNVYKIGEGNKKWELFSISGPQGTRWYRADVNTGEGVFTLEIEATLSQRAYYSDIAIDDITFTYKPCKEHEGITTDEPRFDCDFENDLCSWSQSEGGSLKWRQEQVSFEIPGRNDVPPQSNGTSYAVLYRARSGSRAGLDLTSPALSLNNDACMTFWFKMNGRMASKLSVSRIYYWSDSPSQTKTLFFTTKKTEGWVQAFVTLPKATFFLVAIRGESDRWSYGSINVDDIHLTRDGPCPKVNQEELINCHFDRDFCLWYMVSMKTEGDWLRTKDPTPTNETGPSHDHSGDGYFIFLDGAGVDVAKLYSPLFNVSYGGACLSFWYFMYGEDVYRLELAYKAYGHDADVIWSLEGPQVNRWVHQNVSLDSNTDVYLLFTAKRGYFPRSDIALDDISISFGAPCGSGLVQETTAVPSSAIPDESNMSATTTTLATTQSSTDTPPLQPPQLLVEGDTNPAYKNSHVELVCQHPDETLEIKWFVQQGYPTNKLEEIYDYHGLRRLVFEQIQTWDKGSYVCEVSRYTRGFHERQMSDPVVLDVVIDHRASPLLEVEDDAALIDHNVVDFEVNRVVKLVCGRQVHGGIYHWSTTSPVFTDSSLPNTRFFVLNDTQPEHSGLYSCSISKDELSTSRSNILKIIVKNGKRCQYGGQCVGEAYTGHCGYDNRCECDRKAVLDGRACKVKPNKPTIITSPGFQEFNIGETFYLICNPSAPVHSNLTFSFTRLNHTSDKIQDRRDISPFRVSKISNASVNDSGRYVCFVTYDNVKSSYSDEINVQVRDFINLSCDFSDDFCDWSLGHDVGTTEFVAASRSDDDGSTHEPSGTFIQLVASETLVPNRAILVSPTIERVTLDSCLSFWYRLNSPDSHSLSVWKFSTKKIGERPSDYVGTEVWTVVGDTGNKWIWQNVTIGKGNEFYITFDAIGQAAIDDVIFTYRGACK